MKVLVTGGAGFVGSHAAEYYANAGDDVVVYDNLSRAKLLQQNDTNARHNWEYLSARKGIAMVEGDVRDYDLLKPYVADADVILHTAGQTAVTTSVTDPEPDFMVNALGTFNVLEAARAREHVRVLRVGVALAEDLGGAEAHAVVQVRLALPLHDTPRFVRLYL